MPQQAIVLTLSENYEKYAQNVLELLENHEIRATVDDRGETMGRKIREAEMQKLPFMLIIGEKEANDGTVSVRKHGGEDLGTMTVAEFAEVVNTEINKTLKKFEV
jgi:threonyl-tRNA synthetase